METLLVDLYHEHRVLTQELHSLHMKMELQSQRTASNFLLLRKDVIALKSELKKPRVISFSDLTKPIWFKLVMIGGSAWALGSGKVTEGSAKAIVELLKLF